MKRTLLLVLMALFTGFASAQSVPETNKAQFKENTAELQNLNLSNQKFQNAQPLERTCNTLAPNSAKNQKLPRNFNMAVSGCLSTKAVADGEDMIKEAPAGTPSTYLRKGSCYYTEDGVSFEEGAQSGIMNVVLAEDGKTIYIKEFVSLTSGLGTWVKGELSADGKKITIPVGQNVAWYRKRGAYLKTVVCDYDAKKQTFIENKDIKEITLTVDGKNVTLNGTNNRRIIGLVYTDTGEWGLYGDYKSSYTLFEDQLVTVPETAKIVPFLMSCDDNYGYRVYYQIKIGFDKDDVYIKGLCATTTPEGWVKGTKNEKGDITIPSDQFTGYYDGKFAIFFSSANNWNGNMTKVPFVLRYNPADGTYSTNNWIVENTSKENFTIVNTLSAIRMDELPDMKFTTDMITERPEGELKAYTRTGWGIFPYREKPVKMVQDNYVIQVIYAPDGKTVYMKNPISQYQTKAWVKGTIKDNKITMPLFQCIAYDEWNGYGMLTAKIHYNDSLQAFKPDYKATEMTFSIDPETDVISLDNSSIDDLYGIIFSNTLQWNMYGDYASTYTPLTEKTTTIPAHLKKEKWSFEFDYYNFYGYDYVNVAVDGDKMYIDNLPETADSIAIVGTIKDGKVTFAGNQYVGYHALQDAVSYFGGGTYSVDVIEDPNTGGVTRIFNYIYDPNFSMTYDAEKKTLKGTDNSIFFLNIGKFGKNVMAHWAGGKPNMAYYEDVASQPCDPSFKETERYPSENLEILSLSIPNKDTAGKFIDPKNLSYQIFTKKDGVESVFVFKQDTYWSLDGDKDVLPFDFTDSYFIGWGGGTLFIYGTDYDDIAVQVINNSGGKEVRSNKVWRSISTGIESTTGNDKVIDNVAYYNLCGARLAQPEKGINIMVVTYKDGSKESKKVLVR